MKTVIALISSLLMGVVAANIKPLEEIHHWLANKRQFFYAIAFYAAGFVFVMTGIICGAIEATLQYEAQGFIFWSAMLSLSLTFAGIGLLSALIARTITPRFLPSPPKFANLGSGAEISQLIEGAMQIFSEFKSHSSERSQHQPEPSAPKSAPAGTEERPLEMHH